MHLQACAEYKATRDAITPQLVALMYAEQPFIKERQHMLVPVQHNPSDIKHGPGARITYEYVEPFAIVKVCLHGFLLCCNALLVAINKTQQ